MTTTRQRRGSPGGRLLVVLAGSVCAFLAISGRLVALQVVDSDTLAANATDQRLRKVELPADRGRLFDRNGRDLALSVDARTIYAQPPLIKDPEAVADKLHPILRGDRAELLADLRSKSSFVYLARKVRPSTGTRINKLKLTGIGVLDDTRRGYPNGKLAAQVIGFTGNDGEGLAGLELQYDSMLSGRAGSMLLERDPKGRPIPGGQHQLEPPVQGSDVVTTLDAQIQFKAEEALAKAVKDHKAHSGSIVVMAPSSGEVLAMANWPTYDPNTFSKAKPDQIRNRAVVDAFEPGSTNKTITAAAVMEAGVVTPSTMLTVPDRLPLCPNKTFSDSHEHETENIPFSQVVAESSNVGTIMVAKQLGPEKLAKAALDFGYGKQTGVGFPGESAGLVNPVSEWGCTDLGVNAIGQGVATTVLQMASVYATVANDGVLVQPSLVRGVIDPWGEYKDNPPPATRSVISPATAHALTGILTKVTKEGGTGTEAAVSGYAVAGKTGTARVPDLKKGGYIPGAYFASFMGFAPAERAKEGVVVAVVLDRPTPIFGGLVAAPVFRHIAQYAVTRLGLPPARRGTGTSPGRGAAP